MTLAVHHVYIAPVVANRGVFNIGDVLLIGGDPDIAHPPARRRIGQRVSNRKFNRIGRNGACHRQVGPVGRPIRVLHPVQDFPGCSA